MIDQNSAAYKKGYADGLRAIDKNPYSELSLEWKNYREGFDTGLLEWSLEMENGG